MFIIVEEKETTALAGTLAWFENVIVVSLRSKRFDQLLSSDSIGLLDSLEELGSVDWNPHCCVYEKEVFNFFTLTAQGISPAFKQLFSSLVTFASFVEYVPDCRVFDLDFVKFEHTFVYTAHNLCPADRILFLDL